MNSLTQFTQIIRESGYEMKGKQPYLTTYLTLDIETTRIPDTEDSILYTWQISSNTKIEGEYPFYLGRDFLEMIDFLKSLKNLLFCKNAKLVIYIHNLNYELSYLTTAFKIDAALWLSNWNALSVAILDETIELRDSFKLFNCSLATATKGLPHQKRNGEDFDYSKERYSFTPLTDEEVKYCECDVVGLVEAIEKRFNDFGINGADNVATVPLTSTGFVRRIVRNARKKVCGMKPSDEIYAMLKSAFRGGNTHANHKYVGQVLNEVVSYDRSSSYPDCLVTKQFPVTDFVEDTFKDDYKKAYLMEVELMNVELKPEVTVPYIAIAKCSELIGNKYNDNGRVVDCKLVRMTITDIDWKIIRTQYDIGNVKFLKCYSADYGYLPNWFVSIVTDFYGKKTSLKGVKGSEVEYCKAKELLNSLYGMAVTDINKEEIEFDYENESFNSHKGKPMKAVLPYQWGVWCTAHARDCLQYGIDICGDAFVYCDTDSIKAIKSKLPSDFEERLEVFNTECKTMSEARGGMAVTPKGVKKYLGVFEYEETYEEFVTFGAKKYCIRDENGLQITVSGVAKDCAEQLNNDIHNFDIGMVFTNCKLVPERKFRHGKVNTCRVEDYLGNTGMVVMTDCTTLVDSDYTLGLEKDYVKYMEREDYDLL